MMITEFRSTNNNENTSVAAGLSEKIQTVNMCIQTYFNLYGHMPSLMEMIEWLGNSYQPVLAAALPASCA